MANPFDKTQAVMPPPNLVGAFPGRPQMAPQGPNAAQQLFSDPKNLATGLVFLAALAQGRDPGQSKLGAVGERALGAFAFRGGLDVAQRKQKIEDDAIAAENLQRSKENEFRGRQVAIGEAGLGIQRKGQELQSEQFNKNLSQAERLALAENQTRLDAQLLETDSERRLRNAQAGLYERTDPNLRSGAGGSNEDPFGGDNLGKLVQSAWADELARSQAEGRPPDFTKVSNMVSDMVNQLQNMKPGMYYRRDPSTGAYVMVAGRDPALAGGGTPGGAPPPPLPTAFSPGLNPEDLRNQRGPGQYSPSELANQEGLKELGRFRDQASKFSLDQVNRYMKDYGPSLTASVNPADKSKLQALAERRRQLIQESNSATSSVMSGGGIR